MDGDEEDPWLDSAERDAWLTLVGVMIRLPAALDAQLGRDAGLSHFEYGVLTRLSEAPDRTLRMSHLATLAEGSLPRLSQVVARLEKRGWVHRTPDPTNGRYTLAILTDDGWDAIERTAPRHVRAVRAMVFDPLTKAQVRQLTDIGRRILRAIDPEDRFMTDRGIRGLHANGSRSGAGGSGAAGTALDTSVVG